MPRRPIAALAAAVSGASIVSAAGLYATLAMLAPVQAVAAQIVPRTEVSTPAESLSLPGYGASAIGPLDEPGKVYGGSELDTPRPIASITKVVTTLVVLDRYPIAAGEQGAAITLTDADAALVDAYLARNGSIAPAPAGLELSQRQIVDLMLVWSANNYAESLATWAFGSEEAYVAEAAAWLDREGIEGVTIADSTGFSPESAATPRALLEIARRAADNPVIAESAAQQRIHVPGVGAFENRNSALGLDGVTGLKTGTTAEAGSCLLFSARTEVEGETVDLVGVVLDAPNHSTVARDVRTLLGSAVDDYRPVVVGSRGEIVARWTAPWGDTAELRVADAVDALVWGDATSQSFVPSPRLWAGRGLPDAATMTVQLGDEQLDVPLEWSGAIESPDLGWRLLQPLREWGILAD